MSEPIEQPQEPEYVVTESQLKRYEQGDRFVVAAEVRSRPHSPLQDTTDCPHHCSVFRNGFDNNAPMEHHCDFLNNTCEVEEEKIRLDERTKVLDELNEYRKLCQYNLNYPEITSDTLHVWIVKQRQKKEMK